MKSKIMFASVLASLLAIPLVANAQGIPDGIQHGASVGNQAAGPVGAVVGGAVDGVIGVVMVLPRRKSRLSDILLVDCRSEPDDCDAAQLQRPISWAQPPIACTRLSGNRRLNARRSASSDAAPTPESSCGLACSRSLCFC